MRNTCTLDEVYKMYVYTPTKKVNSYSDPFTPSYLYTTLYIVPISPKHIWMHLYTLLYISQWPWDAEYQ